LAVVESSIKILKTQILSAKKELLVKILTREECALLTQLSVIKTLKSQIPSVKKELQVRTQTREEYAL
jgi:hypothetical protein